VTCARRERPIPKALRKVDARHESSGTLNQATFAQHLRRKLAAKALQKLHCRLCVVIYWNVRRSRHGDESLQSCICLLGTILSISTPRTKRFFLVSFHFGIFASRASRAKILIGRHAHTRPSSGARPSSASCAISGPSMTGRTHLRTKRTPAMTRGAPSVPLRTTIVRGLSTTTASVATSDARFCLWCSLACFSWCLVCTVPLLLISATRLPNKIRPQSKIQSPQHRFPPCPSRHRGPPSCG